MNTASEGQWREWDESAADAPEAPTASSRRLLLAGAAGVLALAASGLLLPDRLVEDAEAGQHPIRRIQRRKDQQRKDQQRKDQRHRGRRENRHRRKDRPKGTPLHRGIRFSVHAAGAAVHNIDFYVRNEGFLNTDVRLRESHPLTQDWIIISTLDQFGALWIDGRYYIGAVNYIGPFGMLVEIGHGGRIDLDKGWVDGQYGYKGDMAPTTRTIEGSAPHITDDHWYVHCLRRPDSELYKEFEVWLQPRA